MKKLHPILSGLGKRVESVGRTFWGPQWGLLRSKGKVWEVQKGSMLDLVKPKLGLWDSGSRLNVPKGKINWAGGARIGPGEARDAQLSPTWTKPESS